MMNMRTQAVSASLPDFHASLQENFAHAETGGRRTFITRDPQNDLFVIRELLRSAKDEIFILAKNLSPEVFSPPVIRTVMNRRNPPRMRVLLEAPSELDSALTAASLMELADLVEPNGPIAIRELGRTAPMQLIVIDGKHVRIDPTQRPGKIVELNAPVDAGNALRQLNELWAVSQPVLLRSGRLTECNA
jgi:hypothetical protein